MLILLAVLLHFEHALSSGSAPTLKSFSYQWEDVDVNETILSDWVSPETDPEMRVWVQLVYWEMISQHQQDSGERGSKWYAANTQVFLLETVENMLIIAPTPQTARALGAFGHQ